MKHMSIEHPWFQLKKMCCFLLTLPSLIRGEGMTMTDPLCLQARHLESKGIGYNVGYTTLGIFYASTEGWNHRWLPFLDVQGHVFNNGRAAMNAGVGLRHRGSREWGVYGYYDYRNTLRGHYNQVSLGLESLGSVWDFRLNGYHPFGRKVHFFHSHKEFALQGINGEAGFHVHPFKKAPLYVATGTYYLVGEGKGAGKSSRKSVWGGQVRGSIEIARYFRLELIISYDPLYQWIGQGQWGFYYLFGGKKEGELPSDSTFQRVGRFEIIPVARRRV